MDIGYHGDAGGPLNGFNDRRIAGAGQIDALGVPLTQNVSGDQIKAILQASSKEPSPVEREIQHLQTNIKQLFGELDSLGQQLQPVLVPRLDTKESAQGESTGVASSPLHRSLNGANVQIAKLVQQVKQLRRSLSI